jgi:cellobiose phosphorylase
MNTAYDNLFDSKHKILKLFTPAFADGNQNPGYIKGYVQGIRENGGQYTHGAVWGALGFLSLGDYKNYKRGWEIIQALNPALRCTDKELAEIYRIEPYVLSGDVYANISHTGRGGWSWYTGSAAWYYRVILENLIGFELCGDSFNINPAAAKYIDELNQFSLEIKIRDAIYNINVFKNPEKSENIKITLDSEETSNPIKITGGAHTINILV